MAEINENKVSRKDPKKQRENREVRSSYRYKDKKLKEVTVDYNGKTFSIPAKTDVDISKMTAKTKAFLAETMETLGQSEDLPFEIILTSGNDGTHSKGSRHYSGMAVDIRVSENYRNSDQSADNSAWNDPAYQWFWKGEGKKIRDKHSIQLITPYHSKTPHIHMELEHNESLHPSHKGHDHNEDQHIDKPSSVNVTNNVTQALNLDNPGLIETYKLPDVSQGKVFAAAIDNTAELKAKQKREASEAKQKLQNENARIKALNNVIQGIKPVEAPKDEQVGGGPQLISTQGVAQTLRSLPNISRLPDPLTNF